MLIGLHGALVIIDVNDKIAALRHKCKEAKYEEAREAAQQFQKTVDALNASLRYARSYPFGTTSFVQEKSEV